MFVSTAIAQIDIYSETYFMWKWVNIVAELLLFVTIQLRLGLSITIFHQEIFQVKSNEFNLLW